MGNEIQRMRYFDGLFLTQEEFNLEQDYYRKMRYRHNRHLHTPGIVQGLTVTGVGKKVTVARGIALNRDFKDGEDISQEIILGVAAELDLSTSNPPYQPGDTVYIYIYLDEEMEDIVPSKGGDVEKIHWTEHAVVAHSKTLDNKNTKNIILAKVVLDANGNIDATKILLDECVYAGVSGKVMEGEKLVLKVDGTTIIPSIEGKLFTDSHDVPTGKLQVTSPLTDFTGGVTTGSNVTIDGDLKVTGIISGNLNNNIVGTAQIADNAVTTPKIANVNVTTAKLADGAVTNAKLAVNSVTSDRIVDANVITTKIADGAVINAKLAANSVTSDKIADATIGTAELADNAVTTNKIAALNVITAKLADGAVTTTKIADGNVTNPKIGAAAVTVDKMANNSVGTTQIVDGAVTNSKMANNSVGLNQIQDGCITSAKIGLASVSGSNIANNSIGTNQIVDAAVTNTKIAYNSVGTNQIIDGAVTTNKIAAGAVALNQLAAAVKPFTLNNVSNPGLNINLVAAANSGLLISPDNTNKVITIDQNGLSNFNLCTRTSTSFTHNDTDGKITAINTGFLPRMVLISGGIYISNLCQDGKIIGGPFSSQTVYSNGGYYIVGSAFYAYKNSTSDPVIYHSNSYYLAYGYFFNSVSNPNYKIGETVSVTIDNTDNQNLNLRFNRRVMDSTYNPLFAKDANGNIISPYAYFYINMSLLIIG